MLDSMAGIPRPLNPAAWLTLVTLFPTMAFRITLGPRLR